MRKVFDFLLGGGSAGTIYVLAASLAAFVAWFAWDQRGMGARDARHETNEASYELAGKGRAAADRVPADGRNWERLRRDYPGD